MRDKIIHTHVRRNYGDLLGRKTLAASSIRKPASNGLLEIEGYLRVQIDVRFVHKLELKPILADRPLIDITVPRRRATNLG